MKAKLMPKLSWSKWYDGPFGNVQFSHLHYWNGDVHLNHHNVKIVRYYSAIDKATRYEYVVSAGTYGETGYGFADEIQTAKEARHLAEIATKAALERGDLQLIEG